VALGSGRQKAPPIHRRRGRAPSRTLWVRTRYWLS
jgi:hypothetical protein